MGAVPGSRRADGERLVEAAAGHLDAPAAWCPGWVGRDVVSHTGFVHRRITSIVAERLDRAPRGRGTGHTPRRCTARLVPGGPRSVAPSCWPPPTRRHRSTPGIVRTRPSGSGYGGWHTRPSSIAAMPRASRGPSRRSIRPWPSTGWTRCWDPSCAPTPTTPTGVLRPTAGLAELRMSDTGDIRHLDLGTGKHGAGVALRRGSPPPTPWRSSRRRPPSSISGPGDGPTRPVWP